MKAILVLALLLPSIAFADVSIPRSKQYAYTKYDVAVSGGQSTPHSMGLKLLAGSVLTNVWVYINTKFAASGTESLAIQCAGTRDIVAYMPMTGLAVNSIFGGTVGISAPAGGAVVGPVAYQSAVEFAGFGSIPSDCQVVAVVRGDSGYTPYTAGSADIVIEYFRH